MLWMVICESVELGSVQYLTLWSELIQQFCGHLCAEAVVGKSSVELGHSFDKYLHCSSNRKVGSEISVKVVMDATQTRFNCDLSLG